jgi:hypothetical protein
MSVGYLTLPEGTDMGPALKGLHWGYLVNYPGLNPGLLLGSSLAVTRPGCVQLSRDERDGRGL